MGATVPEIFHGKWVRVELTGDNYIDHLVIDKSTINGKIIVSAIYDETRHSLTVTVSDRIAGDRQSVYFIRNGDLFHGDPDSEFSIRYRLDMTK